MLGLGAGDDSRYRDDDWAQRLQQLQSAFAGDDVEESESTRRLGLYDVLEPSRPAVLPR